MIDNSLSSTSFPYTSNPLRIGVKRSSSLSRLVFFGCSLGIVTDSSVFYLQSVCSTFPAILFCSHRLRLTSAPVSIMISSPGLRVPEPLTHTIPTSRTSWSEVRQPFETLDMVPDLSTVRFELDVSLLVYQPLNYIHVTLDRRQIDTKEYTVDDLKDVIYSHLGQHRTAFWMALPSTGDSRVWEVPHTCTLEDLVLYFINSRRVRPLGLSAEYPRESVPFPYRPLHTVAPRLHDDAIGQLRLPLTAYQTYREIRQFS